MTPTSKPPAPPGKGKKVKEIDFEEKAFRFLAIILFGVLLYFIGIAYLVLVAAQFFFYFVEDTPNLKLTIFTGRLSTYIREILDYMRFASNTLPFPFTPFPEE